MKKIFYVFIFTFILLYQSNAKNSPVKDYWRGQAVLLEYNPIFHFSSGIGGQAEMSFMMGFSVETEFVYIHTDLYTEISKQTIINTKLMGWKLLIEPVVYVLPMLRLFGIVLPNSFINQIMQVQMSGPYFGFGLNIGYFDAYRYDATYGNHFGAGLGGKIGVRAIFFNFLSVNFSLQLSGFFNNQMEMKDRATGNTVYMLNEKNFNYMANLGVHVGLNVGFYLPLNIIMDYHKRNEVE